MDIKIQVKGVQCPVCNVGEMDPEDAAKVDDRPWWNRQLAIRGFKVLTDESDGWWSECLHCKEIFGNGWFSESGKLETGWFENDETVEQRLNYLREWELGEGPFTAQQRRDWRTFLDTEGEQG